MRGLAIAVVTMGLGLLAAEPCAAQPASAPTTTSAATDAEADALFYRGKKENDAGHTEQAYALYAQAWAKKHTYDIAGNLAQTELKLHKLRDAAEHITFALGHFPPSLKNDRRALMRKALDGVRPKLGVLRVKVEPSDAKVTIDGRTIDAETMGGELFVDPGSHGIVASSSGRVDATKTIEVAAGASVDVALATSEVVPVVTAPVPVAVPDPVPPKETPKPEPPKTTGPHVAWIVASGVLAGGGLIAGTALTIAANGKTSDIDATRATFAGAHPCSAPSSAASTSCAHLASALNSRDTLSDAALASFVIGGVATLATAGLGAWAAVASKDAKTTMLLVPSLGAQGGGVAVLGTW